MKASEAKKQVEEAKVFFEAQSKKYLKKAMEYIYSKIDEASKGEHTFYIVKEPELVKVIGLSHYPIYKYLQRDIKDKLIKDGYRLCDKENNNIVIWWNY